ncbi:MAG: transglycosylase, partial [Curvibacter sp.]
MNRLQRLYFVLSLAIVGMLAACGSVSLQEPAPVAGGSTITIEQAGATPPAFPGPPVSGNALQQPRSRWTPVAWAELPGLGEDPLGEAWGAWLRSCERPGPPFAALCAEVRRLSQGSDAQRRSWMLERLQPYRVETHQSEAVGLLTGYYEPVVEASRLPDARFNVPQNRPP